MSPFCTPGVTQSLVGVLLDASHAAPSALALLHKMGCAMCIPGQAGKEASSYLGEWSNIIVLEKGVVPLVHFMYGSPDLPQRAAALAVLAIIADTHAPGLVKVGALPYLLQLQADHERSDDNTALGERVTVATMLCNIMLGGDACKAAMVSAGALTP